MESTSEVESFSEKNQTVTVLGFVDHGVSLTTNYSTPWWQHESSRSQYINEWDWLLIKLYLWTIKSEFHKNFKYH